MMQLKDRIQGIARWPTSDTAADGPLADAASCPTCGQELPEVPVDLRPDDPLELPPEQAITIPEGGFFG
jgi:hypothetical protein